MKDHFKKLPLLATLVLLLFMSCSKTEEALVVQPQASNFIIYKNQSTDLNADALQAQYKDPNKAYSLNFYGVFDANKNPTTIKTLTYQKTNNDTIVNLIIDPLSSRITSSYFSVKGVKSPIVMKFDYINNTKNIDISYYNYNWTNQTAELIYASRIESNNGNTSENPFFASRRIGLPTFFESIGALSVGVAAAEIVSGLGGGFSGVAALSSAAGPIVAGILATQIVTIAAIGVSVFVLSSILNNANASELSASDQNYAPNTPPNNPVPQASNPTPRLPVPTCNSNAITFNGTMDSLGNIAISAVSGGATPYSYMVNSGFQQSPVFSSQFPDGSYLLAVKDANGCVGTKIVPLKKSIDCSTSTLAVAVTSSNNNATATASGGQSPYTFSWSNGSTGATATSLPNGNHTVTVTDALGCTKKGTASINFADYKITGASIGALTDDGIPCPTAFKSGNAMVGVTFNNTTPPDSGSISLTVYWDNNADGIFEGNGAGSIDIASSQKTGNTVYAVRGFCWGSKDTVLKAEFKYTSSTGADSTYIIPRL